MGSDGAQINSYQRCHYPCTTELNDDGVCERGITSSSELQINRSATVPLVRHVDSDEGSREHHDIIHTNNPTTSSSSSIHINHQEPYYFYHNPFCHEQYEGLHYHLRGTRHQMCFFDLWIRYRTPWLMALQLVVLWFTQTLAHHRVIGLT